MKKELNKYLKNLSEKELIQEVKKLYDKFGEVRKYYEMDLGDNSEKILSEYKAKIEKEYFPKRGFGRARSSVSRKVITDFRKIAIHQKDVIELILYRTGMMIQFTANYGDIDEAFYNSLESSFEQACKLIEREQLIPYFGHYCEDLIEKTKDFGWGVPDTLSEIYDDYIGK